MASTAFTDGVTLVQSSWLNDIDTASYSALTAVAGTNTITATGPTSQTAYANGQVFKIIPANTNTGATTLNISSLGPKNIFWNGAACVGGELRANIPCAVRYDGTQFHVVGNGFNAPFLDTHPVAQGSADSTKKVRLEVDGLTTATTRVVTVPDRDITIGDLSGIANSLSGDVALNNVATYFDGPSVAQGTVGTWFASGIITCTDTAAAADLYFKLWDGTTTISSGHLIVPGGNQTPSISVSGFITNPAGNIRISVKDITSINGVIKFNVTGTSKDSTLSAIRIA